MSASLVGSEMCIRDRPAGAATISAPSQPPAVGQPRQQVAGIPVGGALDAVSYTHLTLPTICSV
eukprot:7529037-Alexandrium_andersonii.AAC.1